jgi:protein-tyrosine phosphatase
MAGGMLGRLLPGVVVTSAGLDAPVGRLAAPEAVALMRAHGVDLSSHRAVRLTASLCREADLILVMIAVQRRELEARVPFARGRAFLVRAVDGIDVFDPVGQSIEQFRRCCALLTQGVTQWATRIRQMNLRDEGARQ